MLDVDRFFTKIDIQNNGCWLWTGSFGGGACAYPRFYWNRSNGYAHRFSCEFFNGRIPDGYTVDHLCKNTKCVNPKHLEAVTMKENGLRGNTFQGINSRKTHCPKGHAYTQDNLVNTFRGNRICKICTRNKQRIKQNWQGGPYNRYKTHCKHGHEFTKENIILRKDRLGTRECRTCHYQYNKKKIKV